MLLYVRLLVFFVCFCFFVFFGGEGGGHNLTLVCMVGLLMRMLIRHLGFMGTFFILLFFLIPIFTA